uniref:Ig-like domain-containing protein n=1 Tax=Bos mutus grunniens TaxID=30521 RepID=A0A8B9XZZ3_BOSMU
MKMAWCLDFLPFHLLICLISDQLLTPCSALFAVIGPPGHILVMVGEDAELPCHLSPKMSVETMELKWVRSSLRQVVFMYAHGKEVEDRQTAEYQGRTEILRDDITAGKAVLRIHNVRASDSGNYLSLLELKVAGEPSSSVLSVFLLGPRNRCRVSAPNPPLKALDAEGQNMPAVTAPPAADGAGLYAVTSSLIVKGGSGEGVSCIIRNPLLNQEKTARISIANPFFSRAQRWIIAFAGTLTVSLLLLAGAGYFLCLQRKEKETLFTEKERAKKEKETAWAEKEQEQRIKERSST